MDNYRRNGGGNYADSLLEDPSKVLSHPPYHNVGVYTSSLGLSVTVLDIVHLFDRKSPKDLPSLIDHELDGPILKV